MTIVSYVVIHPNPGVQWDEVQKQLKKTTDMARKHGAGLLLAEIRDIIGS